MHEITINSKFANEEIVGNVIAFDKGDKKVFKVQTNTTINHSYPFVNF
mgnify:CR=1 FL=1